MEQEHGVYKSTLGARPGLIHISGKRACSVYNSKVVELCDPCRQRVRAGYRVPLRGKRGSPVGAATAGRYCGAPPTRPCNAYYTPERRWEH
eukprot:1157988-Pelagomonas_calceolata.AAC.6